MLISHEVPISLLNQSLHFNDYNYCLVHLCELHPEYEDFYQKSRINGKELLLDNSIFELGKAFDASKFAHYVDKLRPTYYVIPDSLENYDETVTNYKSFITTYKDLPGAKIGVVQGKTYDELVNCYKFMSDNADYIALSFDLSFYQVVGRGDTKLKKQCTGRQMLIRMLIDDNIINHDKPHHLLGCSLAKEFSWYTQFSCFRSCDTSNPIVAGILGYTYSGTFGLQNKPSIKLADLIEHKVSDIEYNKIEYNVIQFRKMVHGNLNS